MALLDFNSRPSARGDGFGETASGRNYKFQFTPLREGRLVDSLFNEARLNISIHAPPRGATYRRGGSEGE